MSGEWVRPKQSLVSVKLFGLPLRQQMKLKFILSRFVIYPVTVKCVSAIFHRMIHGWTELYLLSAERGCHDFQRT